MRGCVKAEKRERVDAKMGRCGKMFRIYAFTHRRIYLYIVLGVINGNRYDLHPDRVPALRR
jgi:hypothetical protein